MSRWPNLTKAPLVEGLVDFRVVRSPTVTTERLQAAADELAAEYPSRQQRRMWTGQIELSATEEAKVSTRTEPDAIVLRSADERWVVQFQLDGFTVSRLSPYSSWDDLSARCKALWPHYVAAAQPLRTTRVAARFVNRVPLPPGEPLDQTFATTFAVAETLPHAVAGFLLRMVVPFEAEQSTAIITQALEPGNSDCVFDLDAFAIREEGFSDSQLWERLNVLREIKNSLFFGGLTSAALKRFM